MRLDILILQSNLYQADLFSGPLEIERPFKKNTLYYKSEATVRNVLYFWDYVRNYIDVIAFICLLKEE